MHAKLMAGERLSFDEAAQFMREVMSGDVSNTRLAAALAALRVRGETSEEMAGFAAAMREMAVAVEVSRGTPLLDTCGTGGDGAHTFNISTTAAFVVAAAGVRVAKHGNRAASSRAGSADLLEELGVNLEASPARIAAAVDEVGIGFLFARAHHPAMRYAAPVRADLGVRTVFNLLGPLTNPARPTHQVLGVFAPALTTKMAEVLARLGAHGAMVVYGAGLDELTVCGENTVAELAGGEVRPYVLHPEEVGLACHPRDGIAGADAAYNATITRQILAGKGTPAQREVVAINAGAALYLAGVVPSLHAGVQRALEVIASGEGLRRLEAYAAFTRGERLAG
ncbi:anthranilate phosphoribosyltransferase [Deinobacterium chartae]|uniref:Anthranilate phosphoribosyltransferase n=1 Tax=Deinobacterium chartae TaxID=521158 RepID=A0A841I0L0_9DEIO|nr:anthranilate phosphoribosyltransferase [Deinobacterium chartae]MBB6097959.1 anthranilate phosphoribosyltransferase [Deinobacterium chartae]